MTDVKPAKNGLSRGAQYGIFLVSMLSFLGGAALMAMSFMKLVEPNTILIVSLMGVIPIICLIVMKKFGPKRPPRKQRGR